MKWDSTNRELSAFDFDCSFGKQRGMPSLQQLYIELCFKASLERPHWIGRDSAVWRNVQLTDVQYIRNTNAHDTEIQLQERDTTCCLAKCPISQYQRGLWVEQVGRDNLMTIFDIWKLVLPWNLLFSMSENCIFSRWLKQLFALATLWVSMIKSDIIGFNLTVHFRSLLVDCNWIYWTLVEGVTCRNISM